MSTSAPTLAYIDDFLAKLPPGTRADEAKLAADFAVALKLELAAAIQIYGPKFPFVRGLMIKIVNDTIDNAIAALAQQTGA